MQDRHPDNEDNHQKHNVLILQDAMQHQSLMKVNQYLFYLVLSLMALVLVLGYLLWPSQDPLEKLQVKHNSLAQANPALSAEINTLKGQMVGLVSGSIESKLRILEESVRLGSTNSALGTIQDLKRDLQVLESYSEPATKQTSDKVANEAILKEVSHLKHLIYMTLASASLMFAAVAGIWFKKRYRLSHLKNAYLANRK